jgi:hypothetical protein
MEVVSGGAWGAKVGGAACRPVEASSWGQGWEGEPTSIAEDDLISTGDQRRQGRCEEAWTRVRWSSMPVGVAEGLCNKPVFCERKPVSLHLGGSPKRATTCNPLSQQYQNPYRKKKIEYNIYLLH